MNGQKDDPEKRYWAIRRRWLWPAHGIAAATLGLFIALDVVVDAWLLLIVLLLALLSFDLSLSARMEMRRKQTLEAVILWVGVVLVGSGAAFSLVIWITGVTGGSG